MTTRVSTDGSSKALFSPYSSRVQVDIGALSHQGHRRENNEDHFFVTKLSRGLETLMTSLSPGDVPTLAEEVNYVLVVADGMGGHAAGEVASRMAISELINIALQLPDWILKVDDEHVSEIEQRARGRVQEIGSKIIEQGRRDPSLRGMGTTLTIARSLGRDLLITHVGDSRASLLRGERLHHLTRDHTYAQMLMDRGHLAAADVAKSRFRHVLANALGGSTEETRVDVDLMRLADGDRLLLCSDGLTDMVDDDTIAQILRDASGAQNACDRLVQRALDNGGHDNVTVIVASYQLPAESV